MTGRAAPLIERERARAAPAAREPTVSTGLVRGVLQGATMFGVPTAPLLALLGPHAARLDDPDHRIPALLHARVFEATAAAAGPDDFGVSYGAAARLSHLGVLGFLLRASATLRAAFEAYERYQRAVGDTLQLRLTQRDDLALLSILAMHPSAEHPQRVQALMASVHVLTRELCERALPWRLVTLPEAAPRAGSRPGALERLLGIRPQPGPAALGFDAGALDWPVRDAVQEPAVVSALRGHLEARLRATAPTGWAERGTAAVRHLHAHAQRPTVKALAQALGVTPRVLQLRLQAEGSTVRGLVQSATVALATEHLQAGASTTEVSALLGFSEDAAFFRAFRRWTGLTPRQARERVGSGLG